MVDDTTCSDQASGTSLLINSLRADRIRKCGMADVSGACDINVSEACAVTMLHPAIQVPRSLPLCRALPLSLPVPDSGVPGIQEYNATQMWIIERLIPLQLPFYCYEKVKDDFRYEE